MRCTLRAGVEVALLRDAGAEPGGPDIAVTTLPNGVVTTDIADPAGRLLSTESLKSTTVLQRLLYKYERGTKQVRLRSQETDQAGNVTSYSYDDAMDRLLQAQTKNSAGTITKTYQYAYDSALNLTKRTVDSGTPTHYRVNEANQLCWTSPRR